MKILFKNKWLSLKKITFGDSSYVFAHESRCDGKIIAVLPFRYESNGDVSFLLRKEIVPCWGEEFKLSIVSITGGVEDSIESTVVHELKEEAGIEIKESDLISLGTCRGTKSIDTVYYLFGVNVTESEFSKHSGDGSYLESIASCFWSKNIDDAIDPILYVMFHRLTKVIS